MEPEKQPPKEPEPTPPQRAEGENQPLQEKVPETSPPRPAEGESQPPILRTPQVAPKAKLAQPKPPAPEEHDEEVVFEETHGAPPWVVTFADMIMLLLSFFILLFTMSSIEEKKFQQLRRSLHIALTAEGGAGVGGTGVGGGGGGGRGGGGGGGGSGGGGEGGYQIIQERTEVMTEGVDESTVHGMDQVGSMVAKEMEDIASEAERFIYKNQLSGRAEVIQDERGTVIAIADVALFKPGEARLTPEGEKTMKQMAELIKQFNYEVKIGGHTDNTPVRAERFPSNWEMSASRAGDAVRLLIRQGVSPGKLSVEGFAEFRPRVANDTPEHRAQNRRLEVVYHKGSIRQHMLNILRTGGGSGK
jgi:chemotaxis protein MotB